MPVVVIIEIDEDGVIGETVERFKKIKEKMEQPRRFTEEDARYVFEDVSHEIRSRQISADKDRRMDRIAEEKKVGKEFEQTKKEPDGKKKMIMTEMANNGEKEKKKMEFRHKYQFSQKPGHATNKQLSFIQELRDQNDEKTIEIEVDIENVPKMSFDEANKEIRRLKQELGWKQKNKE